MAIVKQKTGTDVHALVFEDTSRYDLWLKLILMVVPVIMLVGGVTMLLENDPEGWILFGAIAFILLLFHAIMPKRFQIFEDRLRIVMGWPFTISLSFANIKSVRRVSGVKTLGLSDIHFATSYRYVVEISRKKGMALTISPASGDLFLEQLNRALTQYKGEK